MTKTELISEVAKTTGFTKKDVASVIDATFETIKSSVVAGDEVNVVGFGKFGFTERAAREGRNPLTGETIKIAAMKTPKFKAGKAFKEALK